MPTDIRVIHAHDFIRATPEGRLDLEESKNILLGIVSAAANLGDFEILLDVRKTQRAMSTTDLWYLAKELSAHRETFFRKTAVLCPVEEFDFAGFFALCAQNRGFRVNAFTSFEDAIEWLVDTGTT